MFLEEWENPSKYTDHIFQMDPNKNFGEQDETWFPCQQHCNQIFSTPKALYYHLCCVALSRFNETAPGTNVFQLSQTKLLANLVNESVLSNISFNQDNRFLNHENQALNQLNELNNTLRVTANSDYQNYINTNINMHNHKTDFRNAQPQANEHIQQNHLHTSINPFIESQNQASNSQEVQLQSSTFFQQNQLKIGVGTLNNPPQRKDEDNDLSSNASLSKDNRYLNQQNKTQHLPKKMGKTQSNTKTNKEQMKNMQSDLQNVHLRAVGPTQQRHLYTSVSPNNSQPRNQGNDSQLTQLQLARNIQQSYLKVGLSMSNIQNQQETERENTSGNTSQHYIEPTKPTNQHNKKTNLANDPRNTQRVTANTDFQNYTETNVNTHNYQMKNQQTDLQNAQVRTNIHIQEKHLHTQNQRSVSQEAQLKTGRYFQQIHLEVGLNKNLPQNQENGSQKNKDATTSNLHQNNIKTSQNNNPNDSDTILKSYLQTPYYPEDQAQPKSIASEQEQTIKFSDRNELQKLLTSNNTEAQKSFEVPRNDQNTHNDALNIPESIADTTEQTLHTLPPPVLEKTENETSNNTKEYVYETRYKCRLCGADFGNNRDARKHKSKHVNMQISDLKSTSNKRKIKYTKVIFQYELQREVKKEKLHDSEDDDVVFVPPDHEMNETLPIIASTSGRQRNEHNVQPNLLNLNTKTDNMHIEKRPGSISENRQDEAKQTKTKNIHDSETNKSQDTLTQEIDGTDLVEASESIIDTCESHNIHETITTASTSAENINHRAKKKEGKESKNGKKRSKLHSDDESSSEDDVSGNEKSKKRAKYCLRKPAKKNEDSASSSEESSQINSSDSESDESIKTDVVQEFTKYLTKIITKKGVSENMDALKSLFNIKEKTKRKSKVKLYKCKECSIHFMEEDQLRKHLKKGKHNDSKKRCVICRLKFPKKYMRNHVQKHHVKRDLKIEDFDIITELCSSDSSDSDSSSSSSDDNTYLNLELQNLEPSTSNEKLTLRFSKKDASNHLDDNTAGPSSLNNYQNEVTTEPLPVTIDEQLKNDNPNVHKVYKCEICDICFLHHTTWRNHMVFSDHNPKTKMKCDKCDLNFTEKSYRKHVKLHHNKNGELVKLEIITEIERNLSMEETNQDILELEYKTRKKNKSNVNCNTQLKMPINVERKPKHLWFKPCSKIIYKCRICKIYFLTLTAIKYHLYVGRHNMTNTVNCSICGLTFYRVSIKDHCDNHHTKLKLRSKNDFQVVILPKNSNADRKSIKDKTDEDCHKKTRFLRTPQTKNNSVSDSNSDITKVDHRLYKCIQCNVHYTDEKTWRGHLLARRHTIKKGYPCPICHYTFSEKMLRQHISVQHLQLKIENFTVITPEEEDDGNDQVSTRRNHFVNNFNNVQLKQCVVQLTDLQSTLVSTTSNIVLNREQNRQNLETHFNERCLQSDVDVAHIGQHPDTLDYDEQDNETIAETSNVNSELKITEELQNNEVDGLMNLNKSEEIAEEKNINDTEMTEFEVQNECNSLEILKDDTEMNQSGSDVRNTVIVHNMTKTVFDTVLIESIKTEKPEQESFTVLNENLESAIDVVNSTTNSTITEIAGENDKMETIQENLLTLLKTDISTGTQNSFQESAEDIITRGLELMVHTKMDLNDENSCDSESILNDNSALEQNYEIDKSFADERKEVTSNFVTDLTDDITNNDNEKIASKECAGGIESVVEENNAKEIDDQIRKQDNYGISKKMSKSAENLLNILSGTEDQPIDDDVSFLNNTSNTDMINCKEESTDTEKEVEVIKKTLPQNDSISESTVTKIQVSQVDEPSNFIDISTVIENKQRDDGFAETPPDNESNLVQKINENDGQKPKKDKINIKFPVNNSLKLNPMFTNYDLTESCDDFVPLNGDFHTNSLNTDAGSIIKESSQQNETVGVDCAEHSNNDDIVNTKINIKKENDDDA